MALSDFEWSFRDLVLGPTHAAGPESIEGLEDLDSTIGDEKVPREHGSIPGLHTATAKEIRLNLIVTGEKRSQALADSVADVLAAFQSTEDAYPLVFKEPETVERYINVRVTGRSRTRNPSTTHGKESIMVRLIASDPRIYSLATTAQLIDLTGNETVTNEGNADAYPLLRFYGPAAGTITAVVLTNVTTGQVLRISQAILLNQTLSADMGRIVRAEGGDTPYINIAGATAWGEWDLPRTPFALVPGANELAFTIEGTAAAALCTVSFQSTWLGSN